MNDNKNQFFNIPSNNSFSQEPSVMNENNHSNQPLNQNINFFNQNYQTQPTYNQMPGPTLTNQTPPNETHYEPLTPTINQQPVVNNQIEELETLGQVNQNPTNSQVLNPVVDQNVAPQTAPQPEPQIEDTPTEPALDPLNNANNPVPVNPVAPPETQKKVVAVAVAPLEPLKALLNMIKKPSCLIEETVPKYQHFISSIMYTVYLTIISIVLTLITRLIVGGFIKTYDNASGSYTSTFDISNIGNQDFLHYVLMALIVSGIAIIAVSIIYYASSFLNSKGMTIGKIIMISNVSFMPIIIGINVLLPLLSIIAESVGFAALIISIIYTIILFVTGMNYYLQTDKLNEKIFYNLLNFSIIIILLVIILTIIYPGISIINAISIGF